MHNAFLIGKNADTLLPILLKNNIKIVENNPDIIITYGGDGTLLEAERLYPSIPKLAVRDINTAPLCQNHTLEEIIKDFCDGKLKKQKILKLYGKCLTANKKLYGINDIFIHNVIRNNAIRYKVSIDNELYLKEVASDCIGFATPHGSTGYFQSITFCTFRKGIGIAFSNSREHVNHIIIEENSTIEIEILRGPAIMVADNSPNFLTLNAKDKVIISKSEIETEIFGLEIFMCNQCRKLRHLKI